MRIQCDRMGMSYPSQTLSEQIEHLVREHIEATRARSVCSVSLRTGVLAAGNPYEIATPPSPSAAETPKPTRWPSPRYASSAPRTVQPWRGGAKASETSSFRTAPGMQWRHHVAIGLPSS